jgi:AraC family transcriptional regulator of adaptative response/methylated-DNA-[protein]-cysteine methyltransferase
MSDYARVARVIEYLDNHQREQPDLARLAKVAGLSPSRLHRLFVRWAGTTPKDFLQCLTVEHARWLLARGESVLGASLEAGLSGPGRLHDLTVTMEAASPGEVKRGGFTMSLGVADSPFGPCLIAEGPRGVCQLSFVPTRDRATCEALVLERWPNVSFTWNPARARRTSHAVFQSDCATSIRGFVRGTDFQLRVWRALMRIPVGTVVSYGRIARAIGNPGATRAVGTAVGANPLAYLIPCHRVIRETGVVGNYRWGTTVKKAMIGWEAAAISEPPRSSE